MRDTVDFLTLVFNIVLWFASIAFFCLWLLASHAWDFRGRDLLLLAVACNGAAEAGLVSVQFRRYREAR